jgi:hypothetical protein
MFRWFSPLAAFSSDTRYILYWVWPFTLVSLHFSCLPTRRKVFLRQYMYYHHAEDTWYRKIHWVILLYSLTYFAMLVGFNAIERQSRHSTADDWDIEPFWFRCYVWKPASAHRTRRHSTVSRVPGQPKYRLPHRVTTLRTVHTQSTKVFQRLAYSLFICTSRPGTREELHILQSPRTTIYTTISWMTSHLCSRSPWVHCPITKVT